MELKTYFPDESVIARMTDLDNVEAVVIHHTASATTATVEDIRRWHVDERAHERFLWVGYHFVIYDNGDVYQTRPVDKRGGHCKENGYNAKSLGISFMGNFETGKPSDAAWVSYSNLLRHLQSQFPGLKVITHRDASNGRTVCPGKNLIDMLVTRPLANPIPAVIHEPTAVCTLSSHSTLELSEELHKRIQNQYAK